MRSISTESVAEPERPPALPADPRPEPSTIPTVFRWIGAFWIPCGVVESSLGNWWIGLVVVAMGITVMACATEFSPRRGARLRSGPPSLGSMLLVLVTTPVLLGRVAYLLIHS